MERKAFRSPSNTPFRGGSFHSSANANVSVRGRDYQGLFTRPWVQFRFLRSRKRHPQQPGGSLDEDGGGEQAQEIFTFVFPACQCFWRANVVQVPRSNTPPRIWGAC